MGRRGAGRRLNDQERMEILDIMATEAKVKNVDLAKRYGVSEGAIRKLKQIKDTIRDRYVVGNEQNRDKRKRGGFRRNAQFEQELYEWICRMRETQAYQLIPLTQTAVRQQAIILAKNYETMATFKASPGWFARFCSRHRLDPPMASSTGDLATAAASASGISAASIADAVNASAALLSHSAAAAAAAAAAATSGEMKPQEAEVAALLGFPQTADVIHSIAGVEIPAPVSASPTIPAAPTSAPPAAALVVPAQLEHAEKASANGDVDLNCPEAIAEEQAVVKGEASKPDAAEVQAPAAAPVAVAAPAPAQAATPPRAAMTKRQTAAAEAKAPQPQRSLEEVDEIFSLGL